MAQLTDEEIDAIWTQLQTWALKAENGEARKTVKATDALNRMSSMSNDEIV